MQISRGLIDVTNGSAVVAGDTDALFSTGVPAIEVGDLFKVDGDVTFYTVLTVDSDIQITLTGTYGGSTDTGLTYTISKDFYVNLNMIRINKGDGELAEILDRNFKLLDSTYGTIATSLVKKDTIIIYAEGSAVDEVTFFDGLYPDDIWTIQKIAIHAKTAPVTGSLTIDLLKDGAEQTKVATLASGSTYQETDITDIIYNPTDRLGLIFKSIGSGTAGAEISVMLHIQKANTGVFSGVTMVYLEGAAVDEVTFFDGLYFPVNCDINKITINAETPPVGADYQVDILLDGAEQTKIATLSDGSAYESTAISSMAFTTAQRFGFKTKQIGSGTAGGKMNMAIHWTET